MSSILPVCIDNLILSTANLDSCRKLLSIIFARMNASAVKIATKLLFDFCIFQTEISFSLYTRNCEKLYVIYFAVSITVETDETGTFGCTSVLIETTITQQSDCCSVCVLCDNNVFCASVAGFFQN